MAPLFPVVAFLVAFLATRKSLGLGLAAAVGVGYVNGVSRANCLGVWTTFMFDCAILGLYAGYLGRADRAVGWRSPLGTWVAVLTLWPAARTLNVVLQGGLGATLPYLEALNARFAIPIIYVTHDADEVLRLASDVVLLAGGAVAASGTLAVWG